MTSSPPGIPCKSCGGHGKVLLFEDEASSRRWLLPRSLAPVLRMDLPHNVEDCENCEGSGRVEADLLNPQDFRQKMTSVVPVDDPNYHGWCVLLLDALVDMPERQRLHWRTQLVALLDGYAHEIQVEGLNAHHRYGTFACALLSEDDDDDGDEEEEAPVKPKDGATVE